MKVLYFKGSTKRRREFQIKTKIIEQDGKVVVVKEPIYEEGTAHVYKTYENIETIKALKGYIDVYLPDLKYFYDEIAIKYSSAPNYFSIATKAIQEMYRQVGKVELNENGII